MLVRENHDVRAIYVRESRGGRVNRGVCESRDVCVSHGGNRDAHVSHGGNRDVHVNHGGNRDAHESHGGSRDVHVSHGGNHDVRVNRGGNRDVRVSCDGNHDVRVIRAFRGFHVRVSHECRDGHESRGRHGVRVSHDRHGHVRGHHDRVHGHRGHDRVSLGAKPRVFSAWSKRNALRGHLLQNHT